MRVWFGMLFVMFLLGCAQPIPEVVEIPALTCEALGGAECFVSCKGNILNATDTAHCCDGSCIADGPTVYPYLWRIEGAGNGYLFGTIHVGDERVVTLPDVVWSALQESDVLYTEVGSAPNAESLLTRADVPLRDAIPSSLYDRLDRYLTAQGYSILLLDTSHVWEAAVFLDFLDALEETERLTLDTYLERLALGSGNRVGALESIAEQIGVFATLSPADQVLMLNETLNVLESRLGSEDPLITEYLSGQEIAIFETSENDSESIIAFKRALVEDRNIRMAERIDTNIRKNTSATLFFASGVGHMYGAEGLVELLRQKGYTVTRVNFSQTQNCTSPLVVQNERCYLPYAEDRLGEISYAPFELGEGTLGVRSDGTCMFVWELEEGFTGTLCFESMISGLSSTPTGGGQYNIDIYTRKQGEFGEDATLTTYRDVLGSGADTPLFFDGTASIGADFEIKNVTRGYYSLEFVIKDMVSGRSTSRVFSINVI